MLYISIESRACFLDFLYDRRIFYFWIFYKENEVYAYKNIVLTQVPNSKEPHTATAVARKTIHSDPCPLLPLYGAFPAAAPAPDAAMAPHAPLAPGGTAAGRHRATSSCSCCAPRPSCRVAVGRCQRLRWRKETEGAALQWSSSGDAAPDEGSVAAIPGGTERVRGVAPPRCQVSSLSSNSGSVSIRQSLTTITSMFS